MIRGGELGLRIKKEGGWLLTFFPWKSGEGVGGGGGLIEDLR